MFPATDRRSHHQYVSDGGLPQTSPASSPSLSLIGLGGVASLPRAPRSPSRPLRAASTQSSDRVDGADLVAFVATHSDPSCVHACPALAALPLRQSPPGPVPPAG